MGRRWRKRRPSGRGTPVCRGFPAPTAANRTRQRTTRIRTIQIYTNFPPTRPKSELPQLSGLRGGWTPSGNNSMALPSALFDARKLSDVEARAPPRREVHASERAAKRPKQLHGLRAGLRLQIIWDRKSGEAREERRQCGSRTPHSRSSELLLLSADLPHRGAVGPASANAESRAMQGNRLSTRRCSETRRPAQW